MSCTAVSQSLDLCTHLYNSIHLCISLWTSIHLYAPLYFRTIPFDTPLGVPSQASHRNIWQKSVQNPQFTTELKCGSWHVHSTMCLFFHNFSSEWRGWYQTLDGVRNFQTSSTPLWDRLLPKAEPGWLFGQRRLSVTEVRQTSNHASAPEKRLRQDRFLSIHSVLVRVS